MIQPEVYSEFESWIDYLLETNNMPEDTRAYCFNLYDEGENIYSLQIVAANSYSDTDSDWPCDQVWSSGEDIFSIDISDEDTKDRQHAYEIFKDIIAEYLLNGKYRNLLTSYLALAMGYIDGELEIIYKA
ncbi:MAG: hypothetical protein IJ666_06810 [Ruminococcus sp.]|nr:hypothetical protein [Ruminococcus sp.]